MAFVNERIPREERREIQISTYKRKTPSKWTIDREREAMLFKYMDNIDTPSEIDFGFIWKEHVFDVKFFQETSSPNIVKWTLRSNINIPSYYESEKEDIMEALRDAMRVYGFSGHKFYDEEPAEVIINF